MTSFRSGIICGILQGPTAPFDATIHRVDPYRWSLAPRPGEEEDRFGGGRASVRDASLPDQTGEQVGAKWGNNEGNGCMPISPQFFVPHVKLKKMVGNFVIFFPIYCFHNQRVSNLMGFLGANECTLRG
jgi:hypothetical protein